MGKSLKGRELGEGIYQRKDGRYEAKYRSKSGKRVYKFFNELNDAKDWLLEAKHAEKHGCIATPNDLDVNSWFSCWLSEIKGEKIRYGTRRAYTDRYNHRIKPIIGEMVLSDVKPIHCQMVLNNAEDSGDTSGSVRKLRVILREMFEAAKDNKMVPSNPVCKSVTYRKEQPNERRVLTELEQKVFLKTAEGFPYYHMYAFALETGMRAGELQGLKWEDIDFHEGFVHVNRSLDYRPDLGAFVENPPKSKAGQRQIPLTSEAIRILGEVKANSKSLPKVIPFTNLVFRNSKGKPNHRGNFNRTLRDIAKKAGIASLSMHTLRHSFATRCIESGMRPKTLQKILGHSTINLTMDLYVHVTDDSLSSEMKKFEAMRKQA